MIKNKAEATAKAPGREEPIVLDVVFSPQIAADLKAKKIRAFAPISAAELIWIEAADRDEVNEALAADVGRNQAESWSN